jgi:hypothetical protein
MSRLAAPLVPLRLHEDVEHLTLGIDRANIFLPPIETNISSRCQSELGNRAARRRRA